MAWYVLSHASSEALGMALSTNQSAAWSKQIALKFHINGSLRVNPDDSGDQLISPPAIPWNGHLLMTTVG